MDAVKIVMVAAGKFGRYTVRLADRALTIPPTRQPFYNAARALLAASAHPETPIEARHEGSDTVALRSTIGEAAKWTIEETDKAGLRKVPWRAPPSSTTTHPTKTKNMS